jgi:hypothetical protein
VIDIPDCHPPLVFIHEADGSWAIHGLGAPGVRLSKVERVALTESICVRAAAQWTAEAQRAERASGALR